MCFGDSHEIEFIFFPLCGSALLVLPRPHFAANNVFQTGHWDSDAENLPFGRAGEKILVAGIGCELDVELAAGTLRGHRVLESLHAKAGGFQFASDLFKIRALDERAASQSEEHTSELQSL